MKKLLIGLLALLVLLLSGCSGSPIVTGFIIIGLFVLYLPMMIIEGFVLRWLFTDFDFNSSLEGTLLINFVSIIVAAFVVESDTVNDILQFMIDSGYIVVALISLVAISVSVQLFVLKLVYKATISIKGVIGFVFAHIVSGFVLHWYISTFSPGFPY